MKKLLTLMATMLMAMTMNAQTPMIMGENHAMLKLKQDKTYLLLPVQEKVENAHIAVLDERNEMVRRLNVKLAVDRWTTSYRSKSRRLSSSTLHSMATVEQQAP